MNVLASPKSTHGGGTSKLDFRLVIILRAVMSLAAVVLGPSPARGMAMTGSPASNQTAIDGSLLAKWIQPLPILKPIYAYNPTTPDPLQPYSLRIGMWETLQEFHPYFGKKTKIYAYGVTKSSAQTPGPLVQVMRHKPVEIQWVNNLPADHFLPIDYTLVDKNYPPPNSHKGVGTTVHFHGGETSPKWDGHPQTWYTNPKFCNRAADPKFCTGPAYRTNIFRYTNEQLPSTFIFHDHTLGVTRTNVYAGLAGVYKIVDPSIDRRLDIPKGEFAIAIAIQDRFFTPEGQLLYPTPPNEAPLETAAHPKWIPELIGDIPIVNGKVWPYLEVERCQYAFDMIQAANARFYNLFVPGHRDMNVTLWIIGTDGGLLEKPVAVTRFLLGPSSRREVVIDFSKLGDDVKELILQNDAPGPFPSGDPPTDNTARQVLKFIIKPRRSGIKGCRVGPLPRSLIKLPSFRPKCGTPTKRFHTLVENRDPTTDGVLNILLNNISYSAASTENVKHMSFEEWCFINLTPDSHPMHVHLVQFRVKSLRPFDVTGYTNGSCQIGRTVAIQGRPVPIKKPLPSCYTGPPEPPPPEEDGLVDSVASPPAHVTCINIRFSSSAKLPDDPDAVLPYSFDPTVFPGYVWHCHILEHEDNEMMRPLRVRNTKNMHLPPISKFVSRKRVH